MSGREPVPLRCQCRGTGREPSACPRAVSQEDGLCDQCRATDCPAVGERWREELVEVGWLPGAGQ